MAGADHGRRRRAEEGGTWRNHNRDTRLVPARHQTAGTPPGASRWGAAQNGRGSGGLTPDGNGGGGACHGIRRGRGHASAGRGPDHGRRGRRDSPLSRRVHADRARDGVRDWPAGRPPGQGHHGCRGVASGHTDQARRSTDEAPAPLAIPHGSEHRAKEGPNKPQGRSRVQSLEWLHRLGCLSRWHWSLSPL
jgi:hypothetical protein